MSILEICADFINFGLMKSDKTEKILIGLDEKRRKKIAKTLLLLASNPRHPGLHTHKTNLYTDYENKSLELIEAYIENNTPNAWRILFCYLLNHTIYIVDIIPHM